MDRDLAFVILRLNSGGAERQLFELAVRLQRRGDRVTVITLSESAFGVDELRDSGVSVIETGQKHATVQPAAVGSAVAALRRLRPFAIVGFMTHGNFVARLARLTGSDAMVVNAFRSSREKPIPRALYRLSRSTCDISVSNSKSAAASLGELGVLDSNLVTIIENGVDTQRFAPNATVRAEVRNELGWGSAFVWTMVAVMRPSKRFDLVLHAFAKLRAAFPALKLAFVGGGVGREVVEERIHVLGLGEHVSLHGQRRDVERVLCATDAAVLGTDYEGMPNVVLEAQATGLPMVASNVQGVKDIVVDGETGYLVTPRDALALFEGMRRVMLLSPADHATMCTRARTRALEFSLDRAADHWDSLLDRPRGAQPA